MADKRSRFNRPSLAASRPATDVVADWLEDACDVMDGIDPYDNSAIQAYAWIAAQSKLCAAPARMTWEKDPQVMERLTGERHTLAPQTVSLALTVPNPKEWVKGLDQLDASYMEDVTAEDRTRQALVLLDEWLEAAWVREAVRRDWLQVPGLEDEWQEATRCLRERADLLLCISKEVQAIGLVFHEAEPPAEIGATFEHLLDTLEAIGRENRYEGIEPLTPAEVKACLPR